ncbi:hypothetical protein DCS_00495 [Drechmeria coniospora]|uniref:Spo7-like protein n=1 Tax=Drechmeria coniospora TaxID=98403 RepID=A0A151GQH1_DRECN|nr:hypothetical protein DCS_00495 [Drechmeria coniospora]KYK59365.1 hypothetical protein DCS_00495 [Drechmeria coniospora]
MADDLDSIVKGAPVPVAAHNLAGATPMQMQMQMQQQPMAGKQGDPLHHTPSSPSMVYLNLLILEASLRAQFLELRARRRHHTFFLALLTAWVLVFGYQLYFAPREDGRGVGGSIYWAVEGAQKVCFMGGIITAALVWATGIWDRGIRWPRRWFAISNRGLRAFNCKLVIVGRPWWAEALSSIGFFLTYGIFSHTASSSYRHVEPSQLREAERDLPPSADVHPTLVLPAEDEEHGGHEEDLAPGGDYVKLLLLPKPFSATFRENWELYRTEYWERENERRALLREKVKEHDRRLARQTYGSLWWLPWRPTPTQARRHEPHRTPQARHQLGEKNRKRGSSGVRRPSTSSMRSSTPSLDVDDGLNSRRSSSASTTQDKRRKRPASGSKVRRAGTESRSVTPEMPAQLGMERTPSVDEIPVRGGRVLRSASAVARDNGSPVKGG